MLTERPKKYFIEPNDEKIKPTNLWQESHRPKHPDGPGCPLACIYCNQSFLDTDPKTGKKLNGVIEFGVDGGIAVNDRVMIGSTEVLKADPIEIAKLLAESKYYDPKMPVIIRNFTDPGLNWKSSIQIARELDQLAGHEGPTVFITKMSTTPEQAAEMAAYKDSGGKPIIMVTYSGLPKEVEPASAKQRIKTMELFHNAGIPVIASMRPMIEGINTSPESITKVIEETHKYVDIYIVGGLYVYPGTAELFQKAGFELPQMYTDDRYPIAKILNKDMRDNVRKLARKVDPKIVVYDHASCATAAIATTLYELPSFDPLPHWTTPTDGLDFNNCEKFCLAPQMAQCKERLTPEAKDEVFKKARTVLDRMGHQDKNIQVSEHQPGMIVVEDGILTFQELITLTRELGWRVDNLPNRDGMLYRLEQAFKRDLNQTDMSNLRGLVQVGQQWYMFVNGKIDNTFNNFTTLRFSRSATRARIPRIFDTTDITPDQITDIARMIAVESKRPKDIDRIIEELKEILK